MALPILLPTQNCSYSRRLYFGKQGWICAVLAPRVVFAWYLLWTLLFASGI